MLEILTFYVSGFWVWLGITIGLSILVKGAICLPVALILALRGGRVRIN
ncbi:hypothetical protein [Oceanicella sp. SM1341]|nr:hypothetical protein [Oceanicella sp. SM1341]